MLRQIEFYSAWVKLCFVPNRVLLTPSKTRFGTIRVVLTLSKTRIVLNRVLLSVNKTPFGAKLVLLTSRNSIFPRNKQHNTNTKTTQTQQTHDANTDNGDNTKNKNKKHKNKKHNTRTQTTQTKPKTKTNNAQKKQKKTQDANTHNTDKMKNKKHTHAHTHTKTKHKTKTIPKTTQQPQHNEQYEYRTICRSRIFLRALVALAVHPLCFLAMAASVGGKTKLEKARAILGLPPAPSKHAKHAKASKDAAGAKPPDVSKSILPLAVADPSLTDAASASFSEAGTAKFSETVPATSEASDLLSAAPSLPSATDAACTPSTTAEVAGGPSAAADAACASSTMVDAACAPSAKDSEEVTLAAADLTAQIQARADSVEQDREWTSLFDLVVYAFLRKRRVHCCFGAQIVDIVNVFAPWLGPSLDDTKPIARFVGCVCKGGKLLVSNSKDGAFPRMNHWIIGVAVPGFCIDIIAEGAPPSVSANCTDAAVAAGKVGWHVKLTDATGNCGVDAITYFDGGGARCRRLESDARGIGTTYAGDLRP